MALTYHGRLKKKTIAQPLSAFDFGERYFADSSPHRVIDLRLAWETVEGLTDCAPALPEEYDGFWMDIAAHIGVDTYGQVDEWVQELNSGHISLICLKNGLETEVRFTLSNPGPDRYDDERHLYSKQNQGTISVRTAPLASRGTSSKDALSEGAHRVENAFEVLVEGSSTPAPGYSEWLRTQFDADSPVQKWTGGPTLNRVPLYRSERESTDYEWSDLHIHCLCIDGSPADLSATFREEHKNAAIETFFKFAAALPQIDLVVIRTIGTLPTLLTILDRVDLFGFHPQRRNHLYGMSSRHGRPQLSREQIETLVRSKNTQTGLSDWDIAWSHLYFELSMLESQALGTSQSRYVIRSDSAKSIDKLIIHLDIDDPQDPNFRSARRELSAQLGGDIARENSWSYDGCDLHTPKGRSYARIMDSLHSMVNQVMERPRALDDIPERHWAEYIPFFGKRRVGENEFSTQLTDLIRATLPGFQYDRKAHITDKYYLEFVRRTGSGYQMIEVQRFYRPLGFTVRFGVARYRLPFQDLVAGTNKRIPGYRFDLADVAPDRPGRWIYSSLPGLKLQLTDLGQILERRVQHIFDGAHDILNSMKEDEDT